MLIYDWMCVYVWACACIAYRELSIRRERTHKEGQAIQVQPSKISFMVYEVSRQLLEEKEWNEYLIISKMLTQRTLSQPLISALCT